MSSCTQNYDRINRETRTLARGRALVLAVSKTFPTAAIRELYDFGVRDFGESRLAELQNKAAELPGDIRWHYIGNLQSRKVRKVVQLCSVIHSVNSAELVGRLDRICGEENKRIDFLLELNLSGENSKSGAPESEWETMAELADRTENCRWNGLMTMAPESASDGELHRIFARMRELRDFWQLKFLRELPVLSMGMSGDYRSALAEGSTMIRIGTAIFGDRQYDPDPINDGGLLPPESR